MTHMNAVMDYNCDGHAKYVLLEVPLFKARMLYLNRPSLILASRAYKRKIQSILFAKCASDKIGNMRVNLC